MIDRVGQIVRQIVLIAFTLSALLPVYVMLSGSLRTQNDFLNHPLGLPTSPRLSAYHAAINNHFPQWLLNSLILTGASVAITLVFSSLAAWGLARWQFMGRDVLLSLIISLMVIPPVVLVVPLFLLGAELDLIDTRRIVIAIYVGLMMPFSVYMLAAYFRTIPRSLIEAAEIDGASSLQVFLRVVVPLSGAPLITLAVVNALWVWNELLIALVFLQSQSSLTLMAGLTGFQNRYNLNIPVVMAGLSIATLPIFALYLFGQRFFMRGLVAGALKGN
ncbi:MAG TPA: carbohydrate ABC transporter permease [Gaiellales bacterium]|jgi:ABC-type glycerol-3-phosphate transport system permease component|nr:carbohydrate ABC transporter permease [Gaiellales bacterium]